MESPGKNNIDEEGSEELEAFPLQALVQDLPDGHRQ
jgi:hypothetical protein